VEKEPGREDLKEKSRKARATRENLKTIVMGKKKCIGKGGND